MTRTRKWSIATAAALVLLLLAGWFLLVSPKRGEAAELREQASMQEEANNQLVQRIRVLQSQSLELPAKRQILAKFHRQMPDTPELPRLIRELTAIAKESALELQTIAPGAPQPLTSEESQVVDGSAPTTAAVPVTVTVGGEFAEVELFLNKLEELERVFLVTGFGLHSGEDAGTTVSLEGPLTLTIEGRVFVNTTGTASTSAAVPAGSVESATTPSSTSTVPTPAPSVSGPPR